MPLARADNDLLSSPFHHAQGRYSATCAAGGERSPRRSVSIVVGGVALADRDEDECRLRRSFVTGQDGPR
jgi:hypothetical protein